MNRLRLITSPRSHPGSAPRLISVLSGKGGVGKTVLAFNLSERLVAQGFRVLVVDADFHGGNVHILANTSCEVGVAEFVSGRLSLAEAITPLADGFDLLGASRRAVDPEKWSAATVASVLTRLRSEGAGYDYIVFDHSSGQSHTATLTAHGSDLNLLVVIPELTSISDCYGLYKHLRQAQTETDCRLLINRAQDAAEAQYLHQKFGAVTERFLGKAPRCAGFVLEDGSVRKSIAAQTPLAALAENSVVVQALTRIAQTLSRDLSPEAAMERTAILQTANNVNPAAADIRE